MEPYQLWAAFGFVFLFMELLTLKTFPLLLAGGTFFAAVIAYKYPDLYQAQILTFFVLVPLIYFAIKPYIKKDKGGNDDSK